MQTESESERESKCHWLVDRWASGQLRQVDSPPAPPPTPLPQLEMGVNLEG